MTSKELYRQFAGQINLEKSSLGVKQGQWLVKQEAFLMERYVPIEWHHGRYPQWYPVPDEDSER